MEKEIKRLTQITVILHVVSILAILALGLAFVLLPHGISGKSSMNQPVDNSDSYRQVLTTDLNQYKLSYKNQEFHLSTAGIQQPDPDSGDVVVTVDILNEANERITKSATFEGGFFAKGDKVQLNASSQRSLFDALANALFITDLEKEAGKTVDTSNAPVSMTVTNRDLSKYGLILNWGNKKTTFGFQRIDEHHYVISTI